MRKRRLSHYKVVADSFKAWVKRRNIAHEFPTRRTKNSIDAQVAKARKAKEEE